MAQKFSNNAETTLASSITNVSTTLTVATGKGNLFPQVTGGAGNYFVITMEDASGNREEIRVDHRGAGSDAFGSGGYPLQRGYHGTTARSWNAGDTVSLRLTAGVLEDTLNMQANLDAHIADTADAHDASAISYAGSAGISATDVEGAIDELDTEKAPKASPTFTGTATIPTASVTDATVSGSLVIPAATSPAQTAEGSVVWDSDDDKLTVGTGAARKTMVDTDSVQTLTNKTLTAPTLSGPTISGTVTGTGATITGLTAVNGGPLQTRVRTDLSGGLLTSASYGSIPSWVRRITLNFNGVSTNGSSIVVVRLNNATTGYVAGGVAFNNSTAAGFDDSTGFTFRSTGAASAVYHGTLVLSHEGNNVWCGQGFIYQGASTGAVIGGAWVGGGALTDVTLTTIGGTNVFDAGEFNMLYE